MYSDKLCCLSPRMTSLRTVRLGLAFTEAQTLERTQRKLPFDRKRLVFTRSEVTHYALQRLAIVGGLGGVVVIDAAFGAHGKSRPRFKPGTLFHRCSDLGQVVNLPLSVA